MMDPENVGKVLAVAAVYDRRKVGTTEIRQWAADLDGLDPRLCMEAVRRHYTDPATVNTYLMPGHVIGRVREIKTEEARRKLSGRVLAEIESAKSGTDRETCRRGYEEASRMVAEALAAKHAGEIEEAS